LEALAAGIDRLASEMRLVADRSEDVALVAALERCGARFAWSSAPRVVTSARRDARAGGGFGDTLLRYAASARAALPSDLPLLLNTSHTAA
ncbi:MAG: hypothetical protein ABIQ08_13950, partial [Duganella sp.]